MIDWFLKVTSFIFLSYTFFINFILLLKVTCTSFLFHSTIYMLFSLLIRRITKSPFLSYIFFFNSIPLLLRFVSSHETNHSLFILYILFQFHTTFTFRLLDVLWIISVNTSPSFSGHRVLSAESLHLLQLRTFSLRYLLMIEIDVLTLLAI